MSFLRKSLITLLLAAAVLSVIWAATIAFGPVPNIHGAHIGQAVGVILAVFLALYLLLAALIIRMWHRVWVRWIGSAVLTVPLILLWIGLTTP